MVKCPLRADPETGKRKKGRDKKARDEKARGKREAAGVTDNKEAAGIVG